MTQVITTYSVFPFPALPVRKLLSRPSVYATFSSSDEHAKYYIELSIAVVR